MNSAVPDLLAKLLTGVLPVTVFLATLVYLDSYKLVRLSVVLYTIAAGAAGAGLSYLINVALIQGLETDPAVTVRYAAPVTEELLKGAVLVYLIRAKRVGFLVDAAIFGFAVGTGFALVENIYYLNYLSGSRFVVWIIRGFGTAVMHGGTTAILAILSKALIDRKQSESFALFVPGLLMAIVIHSFFNHFFLAPMVMAALVVLLLIPLVLVVFKKSEEAVRNWLGIGFDTDVQLLELIHSGKLSESPIGQYLHSLRSGFRGEVVADMLCYLRIHVELALRAKGILMMRESGFNAKVDPETQEKIDELRYLERSIGRTGKLAIQPILHRRVQDVWQLELLGGK